MWNYELFKDTAGHWRWHLLSHGRRVATSGEAFASRFDAKRAMLEMRANAGGATVPEDASGDDVLRRALLAIARRNDARQQPQALGSRFFGPR
jgi:uncharacterized protein YegP (UPF0339 family)